MKEIPIANIAETLASKHWSTIGIHSHHGIDIMLSSIHTKHSCSIGEFLDLIPLINWCKTIGMDVIQLLPLNDTGEDSSPYSPLSVFALHPIFLSLHALPFLSDFPELTKFLQAMQHKPLTARVAYTEIRKNKLAFLRKYYSLIADNLKRQNDFQLFIKNNSWLIPYALFNIFSEINETTNWEEWPNKFKDMDSEKESEFLEKHIEETYFYHFLQYACYVQLSETKKHANDNQVKLMGDLPFLISRNSSDAWYYPNFFLMDRSVGSPPDNFTPEGQYWNFPAYDWKELEKSDYSWWEDRLTIATNYYHMYRLDHVVGFFRVWSIPLNKSAKEGYFSPADTSTWIKHGYKLLSMLLKNSRMLPIGEDLAIIPQSIRDCLKGLGICGTKVMRWETTQDGQAIPLEDYPRISMTCVSTHDSETLAQWWDLYPEEAKKYADYKKWTYQKGLDLEKRFEILKDSHLTDSAFHINLLHEYLALIPTLIHDEPDDERINRPGTVSDLNWTYRIKPSVEELLDSDELNKKIASLISLDSSLS